MRFINCIRDGNSTIRTLFFFNPGIQILGFVYSDLMDPLGCELLIGPVIYLQNCGFEFFPPS